MADRKDLSGSFGRPPADAPREISDAHVPGNVGYVDATGAARSAHDLAQQYEQVAEVYAPKPMSDEAAAAFLGKSVEEIRAMRARESRGPVGRPTASPAATPAAPVPPAPASALGEGISNIPIASTLLDQHGHPITSTLKGVDVPLQKKRLVAKPMPSVDVAAESTSVEHAPGDPVVNRPASDSHESSPVAEVTSPLKDAAAPVQLGQGASLSQEPPSPLPTVPPPPEPRRPAQSNTDSPSRGLPTAVTDPNKKITGGFGDTGEAQYFPLDGLELKALIEKLLDEQHDRIQDDLRFSIAATYPRVRARVVIEVECYAGDQSFQIQRVTRPYEKTPIDVAYAYADECVFVLVASREEMTDDGESVTPPNAMRQELKLPIPRKHAVQTPGFGRMLVDK